MSLFIRFGFVSFLFETLFRFTLRGVCNQIIEQMLFSVKIFFYFFFVVVVGRSFLKHLCRQLSLCQYAHVLNSQPSIWTVFCLKNSQLLYQVIWLKDNQSILPTPLAEKKTLYQLFFFLKKPKNVFLILYNINILYNIIYDINSSNWKT